MVKLSTGINDTGVIEYYLVGLEKFEDFDQVIFELLRLNEITLIESLDGIHFRIAIIDSSGDRFKVIYHEDVGVYCFLLGQQSKSRNEKIRSNIEAVIASMNMK